MRGIFEGIEHEVGKFKPKDSNDEKQYQKLYLHFTFDALEYSEYQSPLTMGRKGEFYEMRSQDFLKLIPLGYDVNECIQQEVSLIFGKNRENKNVLKNIKWLELEPRQDLSDYMPNEKP